MLKKLVERENDFDANYFMNDLFVASKSLGALEAKVMDYQYSSILIPIFSTKESISSMSIEGTQITISDAFEDKLNRNYGDEFQEFRCIKSALLYGAEYLSSNIFSDDFFKQLHKIMMQNVTSERKKINIGKYKERNNYIVNNSGKVIFNPPSYLDTPEYMCELINFMNNTDDNINPLIKAAIIHSQFESIHPFEDGNGRVGRMLVSLYLYKTKVINFPFFYISEAINNDKAVYYNMLTNSRECNYDRWIKFFLKKCTVQAENLISYIDALSDLYIKTKNKLKEEINTSKIDRILECIFTQPVITSQYLANEISVKRPQANRYIEKLVNAGILYGDDKMRNKKYWFLDLLDIARKR